MIPAAQPVLAPDSREASIRRLKQEVFDVLILGGGINGAGIARDLTLRAANADRPLRVALVEQRHFASGTSGRNSQLIHGGLRYLKQLEIGLVREALQERATLLEIAPHLVEPLPFLIPFYDWASRAYYGAGLWLYDQLAGRRRVGRRRYLSRGDVERMEPDFAHESLAAAAIYYDCRVHSSRLVLENIFEAAGNGLAAANYLRADQLAREDSGYRVALTDGLRGETFEVRARKLVDTTGPWQRTAQLRLVRGSHIILPRLSASENAIAHFGEDGRIVFVIPWGSRNNLSLVGTTDVDHETDADSVRISAEEIRYLLDVLGKLFPAAGELRPISAYSSLRPLIESASASATKTSREHRIWNSDSGVLHVAGGKYTTYRAMSEEATDLVVEELAPELSDACATASTPLGGNSKASFGQLRDATGELAGRHGLEEDEVAPIVRDFGLLAPTVLDGVPEAASNGVSRTEAAVIAFAARHEMARRLADLLFVSTYWGYERAWTAETLRPIAAEMGRHVGWSVDQVRGEIDLSLELAALPEELMGRE